MPALSSNSNANSSDRRKSREVSDGDSPKEEEKLSPKEEAKLTV